MLNYESPEQKTEILNWYILTKLKPLTVNLNLIGLMFVIKSHWTSAVVKISVIISNQLGIKHSEEAVIIS